MNESPTISTPAGDVRLRRATAAEVIDLRHAVLREGQPRETAIFPDDGASSTHHVVALTSHAHVVGCATMHASIWEGRPAWQLRGMAVDPSFRGAGLGRAMLAYLERNVIADSPVRQLWCNARVPAAAFYERMGWRIASEQFEIPTAGPHVRMTKLLP